MLRRQRDDLEAGPSGLQGHGRRSSAAPYHVPPRRRLYSHTSSSSVSSCSGAAVGVSGDVRGSRSGGDARSDSSRGDGRSDDRSSGCGGSDNAEGNCNSNSSSSSSRSNTGPGSVTRGAPSPGLSQAPRAVRRRIQGGQSEPLERLVALLETTMARDGAALAEMAANESRMATSLDRAVEQGAQHVALCTEMVRALQQLIARRD